MAHKDCYIMEFTLHSFPGLRTPQGHWTGKYDYSCDPISETRWMGHKGYVTDDIRFARCFEATKSVKGSVTANLNRYYAKTEQEARDGRGGWVSDVNILEVTGVNTTPHLKIR